MERFSALSGLAGPAGATPAGAFRLGAYALCLAVALALFLLAQGGGRSPILWGAALGSAALALGGAARRQAGPSRLADAGALGACGVALWPAVAVAAQGSGAEAQPFWPAILVLLFASRILADTAGARFDLFWRTPLRGGAAVHIQSVASAFALGGCLTLLFYHGLALAGVAPGPHALTFGGILLSAAGGESVLHRAIVFLFFVVAAHLWDAALRQRRERHALRLVQAAARDASATPDSQVRTALAPLGPTRTALLVASDEGALHGWDTFRLASRRFVRGLVTLLPLLGFLGTVVGLTAAMGALPVDGAGGAPIDLTASLAGLALKFETTMLGLLASMVAAVLLAALDRSEAEHAAACARVADAIRSNRAG